MDLAGDLADALAVFVQTQYLCPHLIGNLLCGRERANTAVGQGPLALVRTGQGFDRFTIVVAVVTLAVSDGQPPLFLPKPDGRRGNAEDVLTPPRLSN